MISGIDLVVIEEAAMQSHSIADWVHKIASIYQGEEAHLKSAFYYWSNHYYNYD